MYFHGIGVEQNFEQALAFYATLAEQGNPVAQANVNEICAPLDAESSSGNVNAS